MRNDAFTAQTLGAQQLWCEVLAQAVHDAVHGVPTLADYKGAPTTEEARAYVLDLHPDFVDVCIMAGFEPEAVRAHVARQIANPTPKGKAKPEPKAKAKVKAELMPKAPKRKRQAATLTFRNQTRTVRDWSRITGIGTVVLYMRLKSGWSVERTLTELARPRGTHQRMRSPKGQLNGAMEDRRASEGRRETGERPSLTLTVPLQADLLPAVPCSPELGGQCDLPLPNVNSTKVDRGVVCDFRASLGTGGGPVAQEIPEIPFALEPTP